MQIKDWLIELLSRMLSEEDGRDVLIVGRHGIICGKCSGMTQHLAERLISDPKHSVRARG